MSYILVVPTCYHKKQTEPDRTRPNAIENHQTSVQAIVKTAHTEQQKLSSPSLQVLTRT